MDWERELNRHKDSVYRQLLRTCHRREDAEDALIETLLTAYEKSGTLRDPEAMRRWLGSIARRVCYHLQRREQLAPLVALDEIQEPHEEPFDPARFDEASMRSCLEEALGSLSKPYREAYELVEIDELSLHEAARRVGLSLPAFKSRLHRARVKLREAVDRSLCLGGEPLPEELASGKS